MPYLEILQSLWNRGSKLFFWVRPMLKCTSCWKISILHVMDVLGCLGGWFQLLNWYSLRSTMFAGFQNMACFRSARKALYGATGRCMRGVYKVSRLVIMIQIFNFLAKNRGFQNSVSRTPQAVPEASPALFSWPQPYISWKHVKVFNTVKNWPMSRNSDRFFFRKKTYIFFYKKIAIWCEYRWR